MSLKQDQSYFAGWIAHGSGIHVSHFIMGKVYSDFDLQEFFPMEEPLITRHMIAMHQGQVQIQPQIDGNDYFLPKRGCEMKFRLSAFDSYRLLSASDKEDIAFIKVYEESLDNIFAGRSGLVSPHGGLKPV